MNASSARGHFKQRLSRARAEILHHLFSAALITCAVFWLEDWGATGALDTQTLLAVNRLSPLSTQTEAPRPSASKPADAPAALEPPLVLTISKDEYEAVYSNTSPLDREKLKTTLEEVIGKTPSLVVLDIDISPKTVKDRTPSVLDTFLDATTAAPAGVPFVLLVPSFEGTPELSKTQEAWLAERCASGKAQKQMYFGFPDLPNEAGVILRHPRLFPSIGNVARWLKIHHASAHGAILPQSCEQIPDARAVCTAFAELHSLAELRNYFETMAAQCASAPVDFLWLHDARPNGKQIRELSSKPLPDLNDRVVFVGGGYDDRDKHVTGAGLQGGVVAHAAIYASRVQRLSPLPASLLDIAVGVVLGALFAGIWKLQRAAFERHREKLAAGELPRSVAYWFCAAGCVALVCVFAAIFAVAAVSYSAHRFASGTWLNPVPLILGMAVDGFVIARQSHAGGSHSHHSVRRMDWRTRLAGNPGIVLGCIFIGFTIVYLLFEGHHAPA